MKSVFKTIFISIVCFASSGAFAYSIITPASSFEVLNEIEFFTHYSSPSLVTNLYDKGDGSHPDSWIVRGYFGGSHFWEDVSFDYERGLSDPYPINRTGGSTIITPPKLSILAPTSLNDAVAIAVYTDIGFFGIVPNSSSDKFYPLYPEPGMSASVTTIYSINTVSPVPVPASVWLFGSGLLGLLGMRKKSYLLLSA